MTNIRTSTIFLDDLRRIMESQGWTDGDAIDGFDEKYNENDRYFFLDIINSVYLSDFVKIRQLYAVYSIGSCSSRKFADDSISEASVTGYLYIYTEDPLTKEKMLSFEGIETEAAKYGWDVSLTSTANYEPTFGLRQIILTFTKSVFEDDTD